MKYHFEEYKHFGRCLCVTNGFVLLKIPLSFGLRIIYCSVSGRENIFYEQPADTAYLTAPSGWRIFGGHRLWLAPESEKSYYPDNSSIKYDIEENEIKLEQDADKYLHIIKYIKICFSEDDPSVLSVTHIVKNNGNKELCAGVWTVSAMAAGAVIEIPFNGTKEGYAPGRNISLWRDTNLGDSRLKVSSEKISIYHKPLNNYFKIGLWCDEGRAACISNGQKFEKKAEVFKDRDYPDNNVNVEVFQCPQMLEFELLGPLSKIPPGESISFTEQWKVNLI